MTRNAVITLYPIVIVICGLLIFFVNVHLGYIILVLFSSTERYFSGKFVGRKDGYAAIVSVNTNSKTSTRKTKEQTSKRPVKKLPTH